jgi:putative transposase
MANSMVDSIDFLRNKKNILIFAYCLMPDHLHLLISLPEKSESLSKIIRDFKSYTTKICREQTNQYRLWQKGFYDHIVRKHEDLMQICEYILNNPVRKELVENSNDYEYSGILDPLPV